MSEELNTTGEPGSASVDPHSVEGLFVAALGKATPEERTAFLDEACGQDSGMRRRVEALLRAYDDAGSFLEKPAVDQPTAIGSDDEIRLDFLTPTDKPDRLGMLSHYEVIEVIGRGGMGIVLRAMDPKLNRVVAIKALIPELAANPNARRRFTREAQTAASISHPHIVTIHAVEEQPWPFLVMECVDGQSLQEKLDKVGSLRLTEVLRIGRQIAEGLSAAHKQGLIHRDIKPANILLENGVERVKITDFGLARTADDVAITKTGEVHGTPQYMSPEQARGERVDHRSDLFSLGCVLYAMCSGRAPFRAESLAGVMHRVINDQPRSLLELNPETPAWLIDIVTTLISKDPKDRFQSADEVADLLGEQLANVQQPSGAARVLSRPRRHRPLSRRESVSNGQVAAWLVWTIPPVLLRVVVCLAIAMLTFFSVLQGALRTEHVVLAGVTVPAVLWLVIWISRRTGGVWGRLSYWDPALALAVFLIGAMGGAYDARSFPKPDTDVISTSGTVLGLIVLFICLLLGWRRFRVVPRTASEPDAGIRRPATVLMWLAVAVVSLMLLAPCVVLIPWYLSKSEPRQPQAVDVPEPSLPEDVNFGDVPHLDTWEGSWEGSMTQPAGSGALLLELQDARLSVELRPQNTVYLGSGTFELRPDTYWPLVRDEAFGWIGGPADEPEGIASAGGEAMYPGAMDMGGFGAPSRIAASYYLPKIEIEAGTITTLNIARDFARLAEYEPEWSRGGLYRFLWSREEYLLSRLQAKAVDTLLDAYAAGEPSRTADQLRESFEGEQMEPPADLRALFNDGAHPAWRRLVVADESRETYRLADPDPSFSGRSAPSMESPMDASEDVAPAIAIGPKLTVESNPEFSSGDRNAQVTVDIRDTGLFVAIRRRSSFTGENISDEETVSEIGRTDLTLSDGTYEVLLRDTMFGWRQDRIENVEVAAGSMPTFVVQRDFSRYSRADEFLRALEYQFAWNGTVFRLTPGHAACVNLLLRRYPEGESATGEELLGSARTWFGLYPPALSDSEVLDQLLAATSGLVTRDEETDAFRLAPAEFATVHPQIEHAGLGVTITIPRGKSFTVDRWNAAAYGIPLGECRITTTDNLVGWSSATDLQFIDPDVAVHSLDTPGATVLPVVSRDADYLRRRADVEFPDDAESVNFTWFPAYLPGQGGAVSQYLNRQQAECVNVLLRALADGKPEMTADEIDAAAGLEDMTFLELFEGGVNNWGRLLIQGEQPDTYRLTPPPADMVSLDESLTQPHAAQHGPADSECGPTLTVASTPDAYAGDQEALVTIDICDTGLFVALRRKSSFSGEYIGEERNVAHIGSNVLRLASGTYEVLLRDPEFGWRQDRIDTIEIPDGSVLTFVVERDFSRYSRGDDQFLRSLTHQFVWNGAAFRLTPAQAACVNLLLRRYAEGTFTVTGEELLAVARSWFGPYSPEATLSDVDALDQFLASTDELVVRVADADGYRLAPADLSTIHVQIEQDGLAVVLSGVRGEVTFSGRTDEQLGVAPGEYTVTLYDHKVQWNYWEQPTVPAGQDISSRTLPTITIRRGETTDIEFARDAEHFRQVADFEIPEEQENTNFLWFGRETHAQRPGWNVVYPLNRDQVACVRVLLHALADGSPEMPGEQIIAAAEIEGRTFEEVFADYASKFHSRREVPAGEEEPQEPFEPWPGVIVRGEREGTWRLSAPPEDMVSPVDPPTPSVEAGEGEVNADSRTSSGSSGGSSVESLDRLIELAQQEHQRLVQLHTTGAASTGEVREAEIRLLEARIRKARAVGDETAVAELLGEIVTLRETRLAEVEELFNRGVVPASEVDDARETVLEARLQLADATEAGDDLKTLFGELVQLKEEKLQRVEQLAESGVVGEQEVIASKVELVEVRVRQATAIGDTDEAFRLLDELVALRKVDLQRVQQLFNQGVAGESALHAAAESVAEAQVRFFEFEQSLQPDP